MRFYFLVVPFIILLCSCNSRIPESVGYPYTQQRKMQASQHWDILAQDLANRINNELIITDNIDTAVFVEETCGDDSTPCNYNETSSFNEAFRDLLITDLVGFGIPTKSSKTEGSITIQYKVQIVRHNASRIRTLQPGLLTALSTAIVVLRNAPSDLIILATGVALDVVNANLTSSNHYEVIITTSMIIDRQYLFRASDIYYINDKDFWHYQEAMPQTKTIRLSDAKKPL